MNYIVHRVALTLFVVLNAFAVVSAEPPTRMPVVPSEDIIDFDWKLYAFEAPRTSAVDLALLPDNVRALHGQQIRVCGFMMPTFQQNGIREFVLQSYVQMRFGERLPIDALMIIKMKGESILSYSTRPVTLEGTLTIDEWMFGRDQAIFVYRLHDAKIHGPMPQY